MPVRSLPQFVIIRKLCAAYAKDAKGVALKMPLLAKGQAVVFNRMSWLYVLLFFPIIDYVLRRIIPLPIISSLWDEVLLALLLLIALWRWLETNRKLPSIRTPLLAFVVLGLAYIVFQMKDVAISIEGFRAVYQYMIAFVIGFFLLEDRLSLRRCIAVLAGVATLIGLHGVYQFAVGVEVPASWLDAGETMRTRAFSIVQSPNVLGSYMVLMSPVAIGLALMSRGLQRWLWVGAALIMLAALVFTGSRGAWFAFAGAVGLFSLFINRKLFIALMLAGGAAAAFVPQISARLKALFNPTYLEKSSNDGRIARWLNAYDQMRGEPVFGLGLGRYGGAVGNRHFGTIYVDSYYFKTLAEIGLIGLGLYLWLMVVLLKNGYDVWIRQKGRPDFLLYAGVLAGLLGVVLHNGVENIFEVPFMNTYFWLLTGFLLSLPYLRDDGGPAAALTGGRQNDPGGAQAAAASGEGRERP
jgi:O-antigen ligase